MSLRRLCGLSHAGDLPHEEARSPPAWLPPWPSRPSGPGSALVVLSATAGQGATCGNSGFDLKPGEPVTFSSYCVPFRETRTQQLLVCVGG